MKMNETLIFPTLKAVKEARKSIENVVNYTPLQYNARLSEKFAANIFLKREDLQPVRSYKLRGAYNKIKSLFNEDKVYQGIVCASAGNHAQGVAFRVNNFRSKELFLCLLQLQNKSWNKLKCLVEALPKLN